jgi:NADPH:quinone reductase-like Zn-dependent oxidoreductase
MAFVRAGEMTYPEPRPGEVRGRVTLLGVNPGDTKSVEGSEHRPRRLSTVSGVQRSR